MDFFGILIVLVRKKRGRNVSRKGKESATSCQPAYPHHLNYAQAPFVQSAIFAWAILLKSVDFHLDRTRNLTPGMSFPAPHEKGPTHFWADPDFR